MSKIIKYKFLSCEINRGTENDPDIEQIFLQKSIGWNEANEAIARREAHNGEYTVEDDGLEEYAAPTESERLDALEAAMLEMMGVTANG